MQKLKIVLVFFVIFITGCSYIGSDRWAVKQGNVIPDSALKQLKVGMEKNEVAVLIGNSLVNSPFNSDRWDYAYLWGNALDEIEKKHMSLYFSNDKLIRIEHA